MGNHYLEVKDENLGLTKILTKFWSNLAIWTSAKSVTRPDFSNRSKKKQSWSKKFACLLVIILDCRQRHNIRTQGASIFRHYIQSTDPGGHSCLPYSTCFCVAQFTNYLRRCKTIQAKFAIKLGETTSAEYSLGMSHVMSA